VVSILVGAYLLVFPGDGALGLLWLIGIYAIFARRDDIFMAMRLRGLAPRAT
jgi:uncharacterized membrane protein HdeD (DUF308 family)